MDTILLTALYFFVMAVLGFFAASKEQVNHSDYILFLAFSLLGSIFYNLGMKSMGFAFSTPILFTVFIVGTFLALAVGFGLAFIPIHFPKNK